MDKQYHILIGSAASSLAEADAAAPAWIKLAPRGDFTARDGRQFNVTPEALVERFKTDGISVPIDVDHSTVKKAASGESAPAVGWIEELEARPDGLYGRVTWLKEGAIILADRTHRYVSPALSTDGAGQAVWLHSAALVAAPAISMPSLASATTRPEGTEVLLNAKVAEALGLKQDAGADEIAARIATLQAKAEGTEALIAGLQGVMKTLTTEVVTARSQRIEDRVDRAIQVGSATPALRDFCITLANSSETLFEEFCAKMGRPWGYLSKSAITPDMEERIHAERGTQPATLSTDADRIAAQLGVDVKALRSNT